MNYMYELCKLFPEDNLEADPTKFKAKINEEETFERIMSQFDISNEFIALLGEMLKVDRN